MRRLRLFAAIDQMTDAGNAVHFDNEGSWVKYEKMGSEIAMKTVRSAFLSVWLESPQEAISGQGFARQTANVRAMTQNDESRRMAKQTATKL